MTKLERHPELAGPARAEDTELIEYVTDKLYPCGRIASRPNPKEVHKPDEAKVTLGQALSLTDEAFELLSEPQLRRLWREAVEVEGYLYGLSAFPDMRLRLMRVVASCSRWVLEADTLRGELPF